MKFFGNYIYVIIPVILIALSACESNFKEVQRMGSVTFSPVGQSEDINLKYTDSGKVKAILVSPLMMDYTHLEYGFNEFPKGVHITLFDEGNHENYVVSDYAIRYENTDVIDLQGHVKITSYDGKVLTTEQLYYDQKNAWFYTEKYFKFIDGKGGYLEGPGIDFSKDFKVLNTQQNTGQINKLE
jgi:LPS export ABC transporter protein LptC